MASTSGPARRPSLKVRRRRVAVGALGALLLVLMIIVMIRSMAGPEGEPEPHPTELGYPSAPEQSVPTLPEGEWETVAAVPLADLPDPDWVQEVSEETGIPSRAVEAYAGAALRVSQEDPDCGIGWNTLAGVGQVESAHGSYDGAQIGEDGVVDPPVIGVPLDGSEGLMEIPDTDDGELDGDDEWDRAVGPMQFIPTTWYQWAQDGNLDGQTDVHQYDDAALTAAVYLCASGEDLTTDHGWNDAVTAYNQSVEYANDVARHAQEYADSAAG